MSDSIVTINGKDLPALLVNSISCNGDYIVILGTGVTALMDCTFEIGVEI